MATSGEDSLVVANPLADYETVVGGIPYILYKEVDTPMPFGLNNFGSICWWNSILQSLMSCSSFNRVMLATEADFKRRGNEFGIWYCRAINNLLPFGSKKDSTEYWRLSEVLHVCFTRELAKRKKKLDPYSQEGVANGLIVLLEILDSEDVYSLFNNKYKRYIECKTCGKDTSIVEDKSCIINLFTKRKLDTQELFNNFIK